jgi:hypothetical protein
MPLTDDDLLDFDYGRLAGDWTREDGERALAQHGEVYRAQLVAAHFAERWCEGELENRGILLDRRLEGFEHALRDIAAHLRQGDFLPDGLLYREELGLSP